MLQKLKIPTCSEHKYEEIPSRIKVYWFTFAAISIAPIILLFYSTTSAFYQGQNFMPNLISLLLVMGTCRQPFHCYRSMSIFREHSKGISK